ncbi:MAG: cobyrinate a,c-diamide synthase, partial [Desulfovibrio sp.]|nr:cobyrinate a,c-diamide synthase [Desulfovibrio sp.]
MKRAIPPGLLMAGTASGAGKTVSALGLIRALRGLGLEVAAAKTGPDFIDTAFLVQACGAPAANLDAWMCRPGAKTRPRGVPAGLARLRRRLLSPEAGSKPDVWVGEGAMGLYDGGPDG